MAACDHAGQKCLHRAEHRADVQIERQFPLVFGRVQQRALVHQTGAVEQDVDRPASRRCLRDVGTAAHRAWRVRIVSDAIACSFASSMSVAITRAPAAANASAVARPMPWPAAVTNAVLAARRPGMVLR